MYIFGSGSAFALPYGPNAAGNPSPMSLDTLQETSIGFNNSQAELYGKNQFPVAIARTEGKVDLSFKFATGSMKLWNDLFFGSTVVTGQEVGVADSVQVLVSNAVTVAPPGGGTFGRNLGVRHGTTGKQLTLVASSPVAGKSYTISGATFTFASGDTGNMLISYTYTLTTGFSSAVTNKPMGSQPLFDITVVNAQFSNPNGSINCLLRFPAVISSKMSIPMKNTGFAVNDFACGAFADASGNIMYLNADE